MCGGTWGFRRPGALVGSEAVHFAGRRDRLSLLAQTRRQLMLSISRFSASNRLCVESVAEALMNLSFLRAGMRRARTEELSDHLRRDVGLPPRERASADPRDLRW